MDELFAAAKSSKDPEYRRNQARLMHLLEFLKQKFWNFQRASSGFDGHSEGLCILAGLNPQSSNRTSDQYGPSFLPFSNDPYGFKTVTRQNQWDVKEAIDRRIEELSSLGLKGRMNIHEVLELCVEMKLEPPWLWAANNDFHCAKRLPFKILTNEAIINRLKKHNSGKGGRNRANKNQLTQVLNSVCWSEYEKLSEENFEGCYALSGRRPMATKIASKIYNIVSQNEKINMADLPKIPTLEARVREWIKNSAK